MFDKFDICQPCVAYDLQNFDGTKYYDDDGGNAGGDMFDCYDDVDYTNVNQVLTYPTCIPSVSDSSLCSMWFNELLCLISPYILLLSILVSFWQQKTVHEIYGKDNYEYGNLPRHGEWFY